MSVRFTSGNVGRLTFEHANRMADAADAVESMPTGDRIATAPIRPDFIVARLTSRAGMTLPPGGHEVWNWVEVGVTGTPSSRSVAPIPKGLTATVFGDMPIGRAVKLAGTARAKDIVALFPMKDETGESWYGFTGQLAIASVSSVLKINSALEIVPGIFRYQVTPMYLDASGGMSANTDAPSGPAFNLYELSGYHGQETEFDDPPSRLVADGPVEGPVLGTLASAPGEPTVWAFEAPLPLVPECGGPTPGAEGSALRGGL